MQYAACSTGFMHAMWRQYSLMVKTVTWELGDLLPLNKVREDDAGM